MPCRPVADLECVFVGHRAGATEEGVGEFGTALLGFIDQDLREVERLAVHHQVALHDRVTRGTLDRGANNARVGVAEKVNADAGDHVVLHRSVHQLNERPIAESGTDMGVEERAPADIGGELHEVLEVLPRFGRTRPTNFGDVRRVRLHLGNDLLDPGSGLLRGEIGLAVAVGLRLGGGLVVHVGRSRGVGCVKLAGWESSVDAVQLKEQARHELAPLHERTEFDPLSGPVQVAASDTECVDGRQARRLHDIAVADAPG